LSLISTDDSEAGASEIRSGGLARLAILYRNCRI
jgi:hypothetical protein